MRRLGAWWLPLLLLLAPAFDRLPLHRDLVDYFLPMYAASLGMGQAGMGSWLNPGNGGGEPWYANPQTRVASPVALLLGPQHAEWLITTEIAAGLALLSLGCGRLARRWGAGRLGVTVSEILAWSSGPVLSTVGVLNNLATLAWIPWMVLGAQRRGRDAVPWTALATAAAWLGGEPQLWLLGAVLAVLAARSVAQALAGVTLGAAVCTAQLLPFVSWVVEGDRGPSAASWALPGALAPADLLGLLVPLRLSGTAGTVYVESLVLGVPLCCCALLGLRRRPLAAAVVATFLALAMLPAVGLGSLYLALTQGMVRFPSRLAVLAGAVIIPFVGLGVRPWLAGRGRLLAVSLGAAGLAAAPLAVAPAGRALAAVAAGLTLVCALPSSTRRLRLFTLVVGLLPLTTILPGLLEIRQIPSRGPAAAPWPEVRDGGRLFSPQPTREELERLPADLGYRRLRLMGYLNLLDGVVSVRSPAPVVHRRLAEHLLRVDSGPSGRWWLDTLAVRWVVLPTAAPPPHAMSPISSREELTLYRNPFASGLVRMASAAPVADAAIPPASALVTLRCAPSRLEARVSCERPAWIWMAVPPVAGWRWRLDGAPVEPVAGPGILQLVPLGAGGHVIAGEYAPPGIAISAAVSLAALATTLLLIPGVRAGWGRASTVWRRMRECGTRQR